MFPPLRERKKDLEELCVQILSQIASARKQKPCILSDASMGILKTYSWPGNVRELENVLERASAFSDQEVIEPKNLPSTLTVDESDALPNAAGLAGMTLDQLEKQALTETLASCGGNKAEAARLLGITEKSVYNKLKRYQSQ